MKILEDQFVRWVGRHSVQAGAEASLPPLVDKAVRLVVRRLAEGHSVTDLRTLEAEGAGSGDDAAEDQALSLPLDREAWFRALEGHPAFGPGTASPRHPLVREGSRVFLTRAWLAEDLVARSVQRLLAAPTEGADPAVLALAETLFAGDGAEAGADAPRRGALASLGRRLMVVSGGPGTGKTTLLAKLLALRFAQAESRGLPPPRIALAAPTGKASQRMDEALRKNLKDLEIPSAWKEALGRLEPMTLHRLLGLGKAEALELDSTLDLVVVDEGSMVDLFLFARLMAALPPAATLVLLGDSHQLASVDAGSVFGDLCRALEGPGASSGAVVTLTKSWRFKDHDSVGILSRMVRDGRGREVADWLGALPPGDAVTIWPEADPASLLPRLKERWRPFWASRDPREALGFLGDLLILVATNRGPWGREEMNQAIHQGAGERRNRPVIVVENAPALGLWNGDMGVEMSGADGGLRVWFPGKTATEGPRAFQAALLPPHQTAYAITIHKSQGSEAREVICILRGSERMLSRQLLYTGLTRARERLVLVATADEVEAAVDRPVQRASDLEGKIRALQEA